MNIAGKKKIVVLGITSSMPVPGIIWLTGQYLVGLERLGFETYYVEAHGKRPSELIRQDSDDLPVKAAAFIAGMMRHLGLPDRWAFHARARNQYLGMSAGRVRELYASAALIINLHGGTQPLPEHSASGRLVFLETDPVALEIRLHNGVDKARRLLEPHVAFFSWGLNYGQPDCRVPLDPRFPFRPTRQPIVLDLWEEYTSGPGERFTTVGSWRQKGEVTYQGETYYWSKDREFEKFLDLPQRVPSRFELALNRHTRTEEDVARLTANGWLIRDGFEDASDADRYRRYICESRGELTVAKDQNVRLRSGWFSDRSACYLAAGRPVVTQDTGFGSALPVGNGLFAFNTAEDLVSAFDAIESDYERHRRAAREIAHEFFRADKVLGDMLKELDT